MLSTTIAPGAQGLEATTQPPTNHDTEALRPIPAHGLLDDTALSKLDSLGWEVLPFVDGYLLSKSAEGYPAKVHLVTLEVLGNLKVAARGELQLHSMTCARLSPREFARIPGWSTKLWALLEETQALTMFDDSDDDFVA